MEPYPFGTQLTLSTNRFEFLALVSVLAFGYQNCGRTQLGNSKSNESAQPNNIENDESLESLTKSLTLLVPDLLEK